MDEEPRADGKNSRAEGDKMCETAREEGRSRLLGRSDNKGLDSRSLEKPEDVEVSGGEG